MFEKYVVHPNGFRNVRDAEQIIGYEVQLRVPYYRGIPMSCVQELKLKVDDEAVAPEDMTIIVKDESFAYHELSTAIHHRWEMTDPITIFVAKPGGLSAGEHKVHGFVSLRISYQPHPNVGEDEKTLVLEAERVEAGGAV